MSARHRLHVNGAPADVDADPLTPLRTVLGENLGLRSVREPCGVGACGACTVLVDGQPVKSCLRPVGLVGDARVTTAEGLPDDDPVVDAFAARGAVQCGYCIPGFVMTVHGLLASGPPSTTDGWLAALAGNLCRCGSYTLIRAAVADLVRGAPDDAAPDDGAPDDRARD